MLPWPVLYLGKGLFPTTFPIRWEDDMDVEALLNLERLIPPERL
jgi:hypothetical protein